MNLNEDKFYIKVIALNTIYNFVVEKFFIWSYLVSQNLILNFKIYKLTKKIFWDPKWF
jgi:hypothetical protein